MFRATLLTSVMAAGLLAIPIAAQPGYRQSAIERRASIRGGGGEEGKCTIEVDVDDVAEVEVFGDLGLLRTLSGQQSTWRRMECNRPMPRAMDWFEFKGIDGRGRQTLIRDPRNNGGRAVVRIEDPKGGREGYTFDLIWRGGYDVPGIGTGPRDRERERERERDREEDRRERFDSSEMNFAGRGDGYFRTRNGNDRLADLEVNVRGGEVRTIFRTANGASLYFSGRVVRSDPGRITAEVSGDPAAGTMYIDTERGRVRSVSMSGGGGRNRFDLRWHN